MKTYASLGNWLNSRGIGSHMHSSERMVISNQNPAMPDKNCFWVTLKHDHWFVGTFLPAVYQVADADDIGDICAAVLASSKTALYSLGEDLVARYKLRKLNDEELGDI